MKKSKLGKTVILQTKFSRSQVHRGKHHDGWQKEDENKYTKQVIIAFHDPEQKLLFHILITVIHYQIPKTDTIYAFAIQCQRTNKEIPITWPLSFFFLTFWKSRKEKNLLTHPSTASFSYKRMARTCAWAANSALENRRHAFLSLAADNSNWPMNHFCQGNSRNKRMAPALLFLPCFLPLPALQQEVKRTDSKRFPEMGA